MFLKLISDIALSFHLFQSSIKKISNQIIQNVVTRIIFFAGSAEEDRQIFFIFDQKFENFFGHVFDRVGRLLLNL